MKEIDLRLLLELMKNSRKSDRELARAIGSSQPTVSRKRKRLEEEGYIREYTVIPDFRKLGYEIMALTFLNTKLGVNEEETEATRQTIREKIIDTPSDQLMVERGKGLGYEGVTITLHKDYESYNKFRLRLRNYSFLDSDIQSFLISLKDEVRYLPLTLKKIVQHQLKAIRKEGID